MATKVVMAQLSPTMEEGKLLEWRLNEGDPVSQGDIVAEIETDKANMEVEAMGEGVLRKILVQPGQTVPVGALIGVIAAPVFDAQAHPSVIEEDVVFGFERREHLFVGKRDAASIARRPRHVEAEFLAGPQGRPAAIEGADAQLRSLQVGQDGDGPAVLAFDFADDADQRFQLVMGAMAEIEPKHIGAPPV